MAAPVRGLTSLNGLLDVIWRGVSESHRKNIEQLLSNDRMRDLISEQWPSELWDSPSTRAIPMAPAMMTAASEMSGEFTKIHTKAVMDMAAIAEEAAEDLEAVVEKHNPEIMKVLSGVDVASAKRSAYESIPDGHPAKKRLKGEIDGEKEYKKESVSDNSDGDSDDSSNSGGESSSSSSEEGDEEDSDEIQVEDEKK